MAIKIFLVVFVCILAIYSSISTLVFSYCYWKRRDLGSYPLFGIKLLNDIFFWIGFSIVLFVVLHFFILKILFFLPDSWGRVDSDGDFVSYKSYVSTYISIISVYFVLIHYQKRVRNN